MTFRVKKGDLAVVISGKDRGREGKILKVYPAAGRALVEGVNLKKRHQRPRRAGEKGSVISRPEPISFSKLMPKCSHCGKGVRVGFGILENGSKYRVCKKCGEKF